jgi:hypothetical protein
LVSAFFEDESFAWGRAQDDDLTSASVDVVQRARLQARNLRKRKAEEKQQNK